MMKKVSLVACFMILLAMILPLNDRAVHSWLAKAPQAKAEQP